MPKNTREMKAVGVGVPKVIVDHVGQVLDRPVMHRQGLQQQMMTKSLEHQDGTFDERILPGEKRVVPDQVSLERREMDAETEKAKNNIAHPLTLEERECCHQNPVFDDWFRSGGYA